MPCQGDVPPLSVELASKLLLELDNNWSINECGQLYKKYKFDNFMKAMQFANKIAEIAEKEAYYPDINISWGECSIKIWTHKIHGLTENDFILAAKIGTI